MISERLARVVVGRFDVSALRVAFEVVKTLAPEPNVARVDIYNLSNDKIRSLEDLSSGFEVPGVRVAPQPVAVKIEAGYSLEGSSQIFLGDLRTVVTRQENEDVITSVSSGDGESALQTANLSTPLGAGATIESALFSVAKALGFPNAQAEVAKAVTRAKQRGFAAVFPVGAALQGPAPAWLSDFCAAADLEWSIQDGQLQILDRGKALSGESYQLSKDTGLIGSPSVDQNGVCLFEMRLLPNVRPGRVVILESKRVRGAYRIEKITTRGDTHGDDWRHVCEAKRY